MVTAEGFGLKLYILGVFTEKLYSNPLECNSNNIESCDIMMSK